MHCRKSTQLLSAAMDRSLSTGERMALFLHLGMCRHCRNFSRQMQLLRRATQALHPDIES